MSHPKSACMHAYHRNLRTQVTLVYRVVAEADGSTERPRKTAVLEQLAVGDSARFGGSFHEPILRGVAEKAKHAFLISTGVGIAPVIGFVEQCVARWGGNKHSATTAAKVGCDLDKITLFAGFREMGDLVFLEELEKLSTASGRRFEWYGCISGKGEPVEEEPYRLLRGRHTVAAPPLIRAELDELDGGLGAAHFHLIGNGQAVKEWSQALEKSLRNPFLPYVAHPFFPYPRT